MCVGEPWVSEIKAKPWAVSTLPAGMEAGVSVRFFADLENWNRPECGWTKCCKAMISNPGI